MNFNWTDMLNKLIEFFIKIVFGLIFFLVVTPIGILIRMFGIDFLERKGNSEILSYWKKHSKDEKSVW